MFILFIIALAVAFIVGFYAGNAYYVSRISTDLVEYRTQGSFHADAILKEADEADVHFAKAGYERIGLRFEWCGHSFYDRYDRQAVLTYKKTKKKEPKNADAN